MANGGLSEYYSILATAQQAGFTKDRKDRKDAEKRQDKRDDRDFLKSMVLKPIISAGIEGVAGAVKTSFEKKYEGFGKTQYTINQKVRDDKARTSSKAILKRMGEINATPKGKDSYYTDFGYKAAQEQATLANPKNAAYYKSEDARTFLTEQGNLLGAAQRKQDEKKARLAREFLASGTLSDSLINQRSKGIFASTIDIFQGDNAEKQDARAREQYEGSIYSKGLDAVETYQGSIDEGVEWQVAAENAAKVSKSTEAGKSIKDFYADYEVTHTEYSTDADGNYYTTEITEKFSPRHKLTKGDNHHRISTTKSATEELTDETIAKQAKEVVREFNREFNPMSQARSSFTEKSFEEYKVRVRALDTEKRESAEEAWKKVHEGTLTGMPDHVEIDVFDVKTLEQRKTMTDVFDEFDTEANMKTKAAAKAREIARIREIAVRAIAADPLMMRNRKAHEDAVRNGGSVILDSQTITENELKQRIDADMDRVIKLIGRSTEQVKSNIKAAEEAAEEAAEKAAAEALLKAGT